MSIRNQKKIRLHTTAIALFFSLFFANTSFASISVDTTSQASGSTGGSPNVWSHTNSGNIMFLCLTMPPDSGSFSGVSANYNGDSFTLIDSAKPDNGTGDWWVSLWYLSNPDSGTHDITANSSNALGGSAISYSGASTTATIHAYASQNSGGSSVNTKDFTTYNSTDAWMILCSRSVSTSNWTAGTNATFRIGANSDYNQIFDTDIALATGTRTMTINDPSGTDQVGGIIASFYAGIEPEPEPIDFNSSRAMLMFPIMLLTIIPILVILKIIAKLIL